MELEKQLQDRDRWPIGGACSMSKVLDLLSTKTAFVIIRECFFGTTRFEDFVERSGASAPAVSRALKQLEAAQIVARVPYQEPGERARYGYQLTEAGEELLPAVMALMQWGDKYLQGGKSPVAFVDGETGKPLSVRVRVDDDARALCSADIEVRRPGRSK
jgi:DNA-binding HxlR family transcriptional regulator